MPVPSVIGDISTTPSLNSPAGSDNLSTTDDYLRAIQGIIKTVYDAQVTTNSTKANLSANTFTGLQTFKAGADIASASTVDLTAATGNVVSITGTTTVTAFTMTAGQQMVLIAAGALPLTYNATTMNINGGVSYTCAAGDRLIVVKDLANVIRVNVIKQDGTALVGSSGAITASGLTQSTARLLGRTTASTGAIEEITVGTGLTLSAGSLTANTSVVTQLVTDSTDIALGSFITPAYSNIGSTFSATIPVAGLIKLTGYAGRLLNDATAAQHTVNFGIRIGTTNYWFGYVNANGTGVAGIGLQGGSVANAFTEFNGSPSSSFGSGNGSLVIDVTSLSVPTGAQTIQLIGAWVTNLSTLKGTVKQTRITLEFIG